MKPKHLPEISLEQQAKAVAALVEILRSNGLDGDDDLRADSIEGETGFFEAIDAAICEIEDCEITVAGCKDREAAIARRRNRAEARIDRLRAAIEQAMIIADEWSLRRPTKTLSLKRTPPTLVVDDESKLPAAFFVPQPPKLDRAALKDAAKTGNVPGAHMTNGGVSLQIRST